jgi:hypothetical protein
MFVRMISEKCLMLRRGVLRAEKAYLTRKCNKCNIIDYCETRLLKTVAAWHR